MVNPGNISISLRQLIVDHHISGLGYKKIAKIAKISLNTVAKIVQKYKKTGIVLNQKGQGRKKKTTQRIDRAIVKMAQNNRRLSGPKITSEIKKQFGIDVNPQTIRNRLNDAGFKGKKAVKKPLLSNKNVKRRLNWAKEHKLWTEEQWKRVIWSDETRILLFGSDGIIRTWQKPGERLKLACLKPTVKHGGGLCYNFLLSKS